MEFWGFNPICKSQPEQIHHMCVSLIINTGHLIIRASLAGNVTSWSSRYTEIVFRIFLIRLCPVFPLHDLGTSLWSTKLYYKKMLLRILLLLPPRLFTKGKNECCREIARFWSANFNKMTGESQYVLNECVCTYVCVWGGGRGLAGWVGVLHVFITL